MAIGTLSIDLEAKLARLENDLARANRMVEQQAQRFEQRFSKAGEAIKGFAGLLSADLVVRWMVDFERATTNGLDKLNDLADATGSSVENLSALEDIAVRTGTSFETAGSALVKFNKELTDAKAGSEGAEIFKRLGLDAAELRRIDPAEALMATAKALAKFADDGSKARYIQVLFGKSVQEAAPFLKDLAEKGTLVATVTTQQAEAAEKFNKQLYQFQKNSQDAGRSLMTDLLPYMTQYVEMVLRLQKVGWTTVFGQEMSSEVAGLKLASVVREIESVTEALKTHPNDGMLIKRLAQLREQYTDLSRAAAAANDKLKATVGVPIEGANPLDKRLASGVMGPGRQSLGDLPGAPKTVVSEIEKYTQRLEEAQLAALDLSNTEKLAMDISLGKLPGLTDAQREYLELLAKGLDDLKIKVGVLNSPMSAFRSSEIAAAEDVNRALNDEGLRRWNEQRERFNNLLAATPSAKLEEQRKDMVALAAALDAGRISEQQFIEAAQVRLGTLPETLKSSTDWAYDLGDALSNAAGDALMNFNNLGEVLANLERQILQIILKQAVINPLAGWITGSLLGMKAANGAAFEGGQVMPFAAGGIVNRPTLFKFANGGSMSTGLMGEAGPEAILPLQRGAGGKLGVRGGGGITIVQHNTFQGGASANELAAWSAATQRATMAAILDAQRRGRIQS